MAEVEIVGLPGAPDLMAVKLRIGMTCSFDETVVIYRRETRQRLGRFFNRDTDGSVAWHVRALSAGMIGGQQTIAAGLMSGWCTSTFVGVQLHLWVIEGNRMVPHLDRGVSARHWDDPPIEIRWDESSVTFRYRANLGDTNVITYLANERYAVEAGRAQRIQPLATSVGGFLREGIVEDIPSWKGKMVEINRVLRCPGTPRLWQIDATLNESTDRRVFLIEENGPERLRMMGTRSTILRDCPPATLEQLVAELPLTP